MIEIDGENYPLEYVRKAISFYEALQDGTIAESIKKGLKE